MALMSAIPEKWWGVPPALPEPTAVPDPLAVLRDEVEAAVWQVLAYQHDGMTAEADAAKARSAQWAARLREAYDPHPALGPDAADAMIAWAAHYARITFASDLKMERFEDWRTRRTLSARQFDLIVDGQRHSAASMANPRVGKGAGRRGL